ncbi:hypothetical protein E4U53_004813 [Claviceps sorghi]|nr:hypothetical protein E4U53_004813 [Claviceps sorghi]
MTMLTVIENKACPTIVWKGGKKPVESHALIFEDISAAVLTLSAEERLVIEFITGETADIMERMRFNLLDHRLSSP